MFRWIDQRTMWRMVNDREMKAEKSVARDAGNNIDIHPAVRT